jgi:large subunit ribosomal protein L25
MLTNMTIDVQQRGAGKNESRRLRRAGLIPGVVYGGAHPPVTVQVDPRRIAEILRSESGTNTLFTLRLGESKDQAPVVMIREIQREPVADRLIHADFVRIDMAREITVSVRLHPAGIAAGVKNDGGIMDFVHREIEVACLPGDIPGTIELDVTGLGLNQHLSASDIVLPERVRLVSDPETVILVVTLPKAEEAAPVAAEAAPGTAAEPEVIKKGKEGKEGEAAPAKEEGKAGGKAEGKEGKGR